MKPKERICGALAALSFMYLLGVAGSSDLGLEPDFGHLVIKVIAGLVVFTASLCIGGFTK